MRLSPSPVADLKRVHADYPFVGGGLLHLFAYYVLIFARGVYENSSPHAPGIKSQVSLMIGDCRLPEWEAATYKAGQLSQEWCLPQLEKEKEMDRTRAFAAWLLEKSKGQDAVAASDYGILKRIGVVRGLILVNPVILTRRGEQTCREEDSNGIVADYKRSVRVEVRYRDVAKNEQTPATMTFEGRDAAAFEHVYERMNRS